MPALTPSATSFADLANITFTADCLLAGQPIDGCDPYGRPFQPYVVAPARLLAVFGLGSGSTGVIGALLALVTVGIATFLGFLIASQWKHGLAALVTVQIALALGAVSPGVILGTERGQIEPLGVALVIASLLLLKRTGASRWWGVLTSLLSTVLKYLTVGMFLAFANRLTFARRNWAVLASIAASGVFLLLSIPQLQQAATTSGSATPQTTMSAFGLTNTIATPLSGPNLNYFPPERISDNWFTLRLIGFVVFAIAVGILLAAMRRIPLPKLDSPSWTLMVGSGGVLLLPYLIGSSHDYRLIYLLPLIAGAGLWWNQAPTSATRYLPFATVLLATIALITSASMLPTPQGWRWPTTLVVIGDLGLFVILALIAALAMAAALRKPPEDPLR